MNKNGQSNLKKGIRKEALGHTSRKVANRKRAWIKKDGRERGFEGKSSQ